MQNFGIPGRSQAKSQRFVHVEGSRVCVRAKSQLHSGLEVGFGDVFVVLSPLFLGLLGLNLYGLQEPLKMNGLMGCLGGAVV